MPDTTDDASSAGDVPTGDAPTDDVAELKAELDRLRKENESLLQVVASTATAQVPAVAAPAEPRHRGRWVASIALLVVGSLLVPVSIMAVWLDRTITDPQRYVETVAPLARNADIQAAATRRLSDAFDQNVDLRAEVRKLLPSEAQPLAAPIASGIQNLVRTIIARVLASDQFAQLWDTANRAAQKQVVDVLTNSSGRKGVVEVDLTSTAKEVSKKLQAAGVPFADRLGATPIKLDLMQSEEVAQVQAGFKLFDRLAGILPWLTLIILGAGVLVAPRRRKALVYASTGWVLGCSFLLIAVAIGRQVYLGALPTGASLPANEAFFDTIVRFLRGGGRSMLVIGLVVLTVSLVLGPSQPAVRLREWAARVFSAAGSGAQEHGIDLGPVGAWVGRNLMPLRIAVGVVALLILLALGRPTAGDVLWLAVGSLVALGVIELVGRIGGRLSTPDPDPEPTTG